MIRVDNGPEFTSAVFEVGKPAKNTLVKRFNGVYRKELLNAHLCTDLEQVRDQTQQWIWAYNNIRPHESLGNKPPVTLLKQRGVTCQV